MLSTAIAAVVTHIISHFKTKDEENSSSNEIFKLAVILSRGSLRCSA